MAKLTSSASVGWCSGLSLISQGYLRTGPEVEYLQPLWELAALAAKTVKSTFLRRRPPRRRSFQKGKYPGPEELGKKIQLLLPGPKGVADLVSDFTVRVWGLPGGEVQVLDGGSLGAWNRSVATMWAELCWQGRTGIPGTGHDFERAAGRSQEFRGGGK
jgi:hypothetical protein